MSRRAEGEEGRTDDLGARPDRERNVVVDERDALDAAAHLLGLHREVVDGEEVAMARRHAGVVEREAVLWAQVEGVCERGSAGQLWGRQGDDGRAMDDGAPSSRWSRATAFLGSGRCVYMYESAKAETRLSASDASLPMTTIQSVAELLRRASRKSSCGRGSGSAE